MTLRLTPYLCAQLSDDKDVVDALLCPAKTPREAVIEYLVNGCPSERTDLPDGVVARVIVYRPKDRWLGFEARWAFDVDADGNPTEARP